MKKSQKIKFDEERKNQLISAQKTEKIRRAEADRQNAAEETNRQENLILNHCCPVKNLVNSTVQSYPISNSYNPV